MMKHCLVMLFCCLSAVAQTTIHVGHIGPSSAPPPSGLLAVAFGPRSALGVGQGVVALGKGGGCGIAGSFTGASMPSPYGIGSTPTYQQTCKPLFSTSTAVSYTDELPMSYAANAALLFTVLAFHASDTNTAHADSFSVAYTCGNHALSAAQSFPPASLVSTAGGVPAGQHEEVSELSLTPGTGGLPACSATDIIQTKLQLASTTAIDGPIVTFFGGSSSVSGSGQFFGPRSNLGVGQGTVTLGHHTGCSLTGTFTATAQPYSYGIPATATYLQTCKPQFSTTTEASYTDVLPSSYTANSPLTFSVRAFHPAATSGSDTFTLTYTCSNATTARPVSGAQNFPATTLMTTAGGVPAGHNDEVATLTLTPGSGGLPACSAKDIIQMTLRLVNTTASDNPVVTFFAGAIP